ncbi:Hypothetical protein POVR1_LOCUS541 [uncultured virus]|nr:Hypothetical protein POVR1_LOCUS541 [uncultured virus]
MDQPFHLKEVALPLFQAADHQTLVKLYPSFENLLNDIHTLDQLRQANRIPTTRTHYEKGIPITLPTVETFHDLIFEMRIRDPVYRATTCLSSMKMLRIAIEEQDLELVRSLLNEPKKGKYVSYQILYWAGLTGNEGLIHLVLEMIDEDDIYLSISAGLVEASHDELFEKLRTLQDDVPYRAVMISDNVELFKKYFSDKSWRMDALSLVGIYNSHKILQFLIDQAPLKDFEIESVFVGYLRGGYLDEAKKIRPLIEDRLSNLWGLGWVIQSGSVESLIYAEFLSLEFSGESLNDLVDETPEILESSPSSTLLYFLEKYPSWQKYYLDEILIGQDMELEDFMVFFEKFDPEFSLAASTVAAMKKREEADQCAIQWLESHIP